MFLISIAALVSGYLIPRLTRWWQDNQKDVEVHAKLASDTMTAVVRIIVATQIAERGMGTQGELDTAYRQWEIDRAVLVGGQLRVYFPNHKFADEWVQLSETVTDIYVLKGVFDLDKRGIQLSKLKTAFSLTDAEVSALLQLQKRNRSVDDFHAYFQAWWKLRESALVRVSQFIRSVLPERTTMHINR